MMLRSAALFLVLGAALGIATACSDGGGPGSTRPATTIAPGEPVTPEPGTTAPVANESGQEPVFWRSEDNFASLQAGQAYKVVFRISNGYAEPALTVTATCETCGQPSERQPIEFVGQRTEPVGNDAPGSYYPMNIELPYAGQWEIVVVAGSDTARIPVNAKPGQSSG